MPVTYEWVVEWVDANDDIEAVDHANTAAQAIKTMQDALDPGWRYEWGVVRNVWAKDDPDDLRDRQWAYVDDGKLPDEFDGGGKVPARLRAELRKALA